MEEGEGGLNVRKKDVFRSGIQQPVDRYGILQRWPHYY